MAYSGQEIEHPQAGLRIVFRETSADTGGEALRMDVWVDPGRSILSKHKHPLQEERIEVVAGGLQGTVGSDDKALRVGESFVVPPRTMHHWTSEPGETTHLKLEFRPALRTETVFETLCGLATTGRVRANGMPGVLQGAVFMREYGEELHFPIPTPVRKVLEVVVAPIAQRFGYRASYPEFSLSGPPPPA